MMAQRSTEHGFTLIELLIASSIFSVILLLCTFGLMQIGRIYYKGANTSRTQTVLRTVTEDIIQAIQFGGRDVFVTQAPAPGSIQSVCLGDHRYSYVLARQLKNSTPINAARETAHALQIDAFDGTCPTLPNSNMNSVAGSSLQPDTSPPLPLTNTNPTREALNEGMTLFVFSVTEPSTGMYEVRVKIGSGAPDLYTDNTNSNFSDFSTIDAATARCKGGAGQQYCVVAEIKTMVRKKV